MAGTVNKVIPAGHLGAGPEPCRIDVGMLTTFFEVAEEPGKAARTALGRKVIRRLKMILRSGDDTSQVVFLEVPPESGECHG